jgi:hypothetical protein
VVEPLLAALERASANANGECASCALIELCRDVDVLVQRLAAEASDAPAPDGHAPFDGVHDRIRVTRSVTR